MMWKNRYQPPNRADWQGRTDAPRFHTTIQLADLNEDFPYQIEGFALVGFACDEGIKRNLGRPGAAEGPQAIRRALAKLPIHHSSLLWDVGTVTCFDGNLEEAQQALSQIVSSLLSRHLIPIVLGGGHEVAWGSFQGIFAALPHQQVSIVNFDAHYDLRPLVDGKGNSGTSFTQIAHFLHAQRKPFDYTCIGIQRLGNSASLFEQAQKLNVTTLFADEFHEGGAEKAECLIEEIITRSEKIYVSLCLDVIAAPFAPGVSAPQPLGVLPWHLLPLLRRLAESNKIVCFDIAELSPSHDRDNLTAQLAASFLATLLENN